MAASFQKRIIDIIEEKINLALIYLGKKNKQIVDISVVGGVAANKKIQQSLTNFCKHNNYRLIYPPQEFCGDNAAMIAKACIENYKFNLKSDIEFQPNPRLSITNFIKL